MKEVGMIILVYKEIGEFVKNQQKVIESFKRDCEIRKCDEKFMETLNKNTELLLKNIDMILGCKK